MKQCPYCGKRYEDDVTSCSLDDTPLVDEASLKSPSRGPWFKAPTFALWTEHEIPFSLAIVSYFYFLPAGVCFGGIGFIILMCLPFAIFSGGVSNVLFFMIFYCGLLGMIGLFWLFLSRGLRRGSRGWRFFTLLLLSFGLLVDVYQIGKYFLTGYFSLTILYTPAPHHTQAQLVIYCFFAAFKLWQIRVLTRPDVRELFGV